MASDLVALKQIAASLLVFLKVESSPSLFLKLYTWV